MGLEADCWTLVLVLPAGAGTSAKHAVPASSSQQSALVLLSHAIAHEPLDRKRRAGRLRGVVDQLLDRPGLVTHPRLLEERHFREKLAELTLDHLLEDVRRLAFR